MFQRNRVRGFSLVEVLLVLALIGILSGIAIPSYLGQRRRARVIGDAISNAKVLQMALESRKAENGVYGAVSTSYDWKADGTATTGPALIPTFNPSGSSKMNYTVAVGSTGITYNLSVFDPSISATTIAYSTNQTGAELARLN
jgi:prepilin-type N-terminal cleavage/methylation domain-containing protein